MFFDLYGLYQEIVNCDSIYIYGMGMYSEIIVPKLYDLGLGAKIVGYVLSDAQPQNQFKEGILIYNIDNLQVDTSANVFLIATSSKYENEIEEKLKSCNFNNYIFLSHYERNDNNIYFRFKKTNFDQYCKCISEWYEYKHSDRIGSEYLDDHKKICSEVKELFKKKIEYPEVRNNKQIVFVVAALYPRINKIIKALVDRGYEIVVLHIDKLTYPYSKYDEKNIRIIYCECIEEVLFEAVNLNPLLFYVRPAYLNTSIVNIMLTQRNLYGKIVLDIHDIAKATYNLSPEQQWLYDIEKDALEFADGVVWRYDAEDFLQEKYGYRYRGKSIQFWDYCYDEFIFNKSKSDTVLKLCCIDSTAECLNPPNYDGLSKDGIMRYANIYDILDKIGYRVDCEFNLYVSKLSEKDIEELKRLKKEYVNFNFFIGYSPERLIQDISRCDYGCYFSCSGRVPTEEECIEKGFFFLPGFYEVIATNGYFDFFNAGIPVVSSCMGRRQREYLKKYGILVDMDLESLDIEYLMENKYFYRKNVKAAKQYLAISAQIDRLIDFFSSV